LSLNKKRIYQYLTDNKINYAVDTTNQLLIYQRNVIRQRLSNLTKGGKKDLEKEITKKNQKLRKIKKLVETAAKQLIISPSILSLDKRIEYSSEVCLRLLYF